MAAVSDFSLMTGLSGLMFCWNSGRWLSLPSSILPSTLSLLELHKIVAHPWVEISIANKPGTVYVLLSV